MNLNPKLLSRNKYFRTHTQVGGFKQCPTDNLKINGIGD